MCIVKEGIFLKSYNRKQKKSNTFSNVVGEIILIFVVATASIVLYDIYINIDVTQEEVQASEVMPKETALEENENDISEMLESCSKGVVRDIKNNVK